MWVVNNTKERIKLYLKSDIESNITNLTDISNRIHDTISAINRVTAGMVSGTDSRLINECHRVLQELQTVTQNLYECRNYVDSLETREWIDG